MRDTIGLVVGWVFILFPSHLFSSPFYSLSLLVVTHIRGHIAGSSLPLPTTVRALHFDCEKIPALSSLVDSRRIAHTQARRSQQLILFSFPFFLRINSKCRQGGIRSHGPTLVAWKTKIDWLLSWVINLIVYFRRRYAAKRREYRVIQAWHWTCSKSARKAFQEKRFEKYM